jgi:hypothetical protein
MSEDFEFLITEFNNWNFNVINKPGIDPFNNKEKLDPFGYNLFKYNCVLMLKRNVQKMFKRF